MIRYRLDDLGWYQFEWLTQALLKNILGASIEAWGGSGDWGRDAYCRSDLMFGETLVPGPHVFQCKFVEGANAAGSRPKEALHKAISAECCSIKKRQKQGTVPPRSLVFITNASLVAEQRTLITSKLEFEFPGIFAQIWDGKDICALLDDAVTIRQSFPQLLSLRDLDLLIAKQVTRASRLRSNVSLERARKLLPNFVPTVPHRDATQCLEKHHFVLLSGPPETGKTATASMIALQKTAEGWQYCDVSSPKDFFDLYDSDLPQVFIADDLFGTTEYSVTKGNLWGAELENILQSLDKTHWFLFTSRTTPLKLALQTIELQGKAQRFPDPSEVLVDCRALSFEERALILFRHACAANLTDRLKSIVRRIAEDVVKHESLTPERIRRFVNTWLPEIAQEQEALQSKERIQALVVAAIKRPTDRMLKSFRSLPKDHQLFLYSCLDFEQEMFLATVAASVTRIFDGTLSIEPQRLASDLTDHFLYQPDKNLKFSEASVTWIHPSWRDLIIDSLAAARIERKAFLSKCSSTGLNLAISVGGGADGERCSPLIVDQNDADIFYKSALVIAMRSSFDLDQLLKSLTRLIRQSDSIAIRPITAKLQDFLKNLVDVWDTCRTPSTNELTSFYQLCTAGNIKELNPKLWKAWHKAWSRLFEIASIGDYEDSIEDLACEWSDAISLWYLLNGIRPQLLSSESRRQRYNVCLNFFLSSIENYLDDLDEDDLSKRGSQAADSAMEKVKDTLGDLSGMFASRQIQIDRLYDLLTSKQANLPKSSWEGNDYSSAEMNSHFLEMPTVDLDRLFSSL